ncbi:4-hydroxybutyrate CoA-transferase [Phreatobacter stygius]|uniref:4-hydroxybutyrate CoA-transferase n=1 Tax=Phreatobacter stygius TaxID=1940610 RepID=A0A4D7BE28_9HYPH|nr:4-hydroxybutyrate CoA-transferase [Phreatobacter stygius]
MNPDDLDLAAFIQPGDRVVCGQLTAEPTTLTEALVDQADRIGRLEVFLGTTFSNTFAPDRAPALSFLSYGATGTNPRLAKAGRLAILPRHYGALNAAFATGEIRADVVLLQVAASSGGFNLGLANDYAALAARHARAVLVEVHADVPVTTGAFLPTDTTITAVIAARRAPIELQPGRIGAVEQSIAGHVAGLIADRSTLQIGIGSIPDAILSGLEGHRDLGFHSGVITDRVLDLIEQGVITNAYKSVDPGVTVTNTVCGTHRLNRHLHLNPEIAVLPAAHTHGIEVLSRQDNFLSINSAIEVDLTGQVNSEMAGGAAVGGVGGLVDFARGGVAARGGRAIIALPATARNGAASRIVHRTQRVTLAHSDVDVVVTEHGVADLRNVPLHARAERLIAIADPRFRDDLARQAGEGSYDA